MLHVELYSFTANSNLRTRGARAPIKDHLQATPPPVNTRVCEAWPRQQNSGDLIEKITGRSENNTDDAAS